MIYAKKGFEIAKMRESAKITRAALEAAEKYAKPGISTLELNKIIEDVILSYGATPSFKGYRGYKFATCISIDEVVVHGMPGMRILKEGEIVSIDVGAFKDGYHSDAARTFCMGKVSEQKQHLVDVTRQSFFTGIQYAKTGFRVGDISYAIGAYAQANGCGVVRVMVGHGIGKELHEDPAIPNIGQKNSGNIIRQGYCFAIEPMLTAGNHNVIIESDGWTCRTTDRLPSAHYENTVLITDGEPEILTL